MRMFGGLFVIPHHLTPNLKFLSHLNFHFLQLQRPHLNTTTAHVPTVIHDLEPRTLPTVSYTHLTLPTKA